MNEYYVYILKCNDESFYIGVTNNLERRLIEHQEGYSESSYTYTRIPIELKYYESFMQIEQAIEREKQLKGWSRKKKQALIDGNWVQLKLLSKSR